MLLVNKVRNEAYIKAFGEQVRKIRTEQRLSQEDLAYTADIPLSQIGRIERGEINPTISTLYALSHGLGIHPSKLLKFDL